jgi:hypothetical protein
VERFDIVKAMSDDKLLESAFKLIAETQVRGQDQHYRSKNNEFTKVLKTLQIVENISESNSKVDRMWQLLVEIVLFLRTKEHRTPINILKSFIKVSGDGEPRITADETSNLRTIFRFLKSIYGAQGNLKASRLAKNQIHFYTMITSIMSDRLLEKYSETDLTAKLISFGRIIDEKEKPPKTAAKLVNSYLGLSAKHTTHPGRREDRQAQFLSVINAL